MNAPVIRLNGVSKSYAAATGPVPVLEAVQLEIAVGQKASLVGPSGSGKSTLLALIAGLLRPDAGTVEIDGMPIGTLSDSACAALRARRIGIALQSDNLIPFLSAIENVALALKFGGRDEQEAAVLLNRMGVGERALHYPRQLSGGEAQRVALAVALANAPALLLADEMVAKLDGRTADAIISDIFGSDMAILFVTHDMALADRADLRLRLQDRRVVRR